MFFNLSQLTNQTKDIFRLKFPIFKILRLLMIGDPVKLSLFELDSEAALARFTLFLLKPSLTVIQNIVKTKSRDEEGYGRENSTKGPKHGPKDDN